MHHNVTPTMLENTQRNWAKVALTKKIEKRVGYFSTLTKEAHKDKENNPHMPHIISQTT